jgi:hypothetical protein
MPDGRDPLPPAYADRRPTPWAEIFRCFQVALDPRKLAVAAAGILVMSVGWHVLSRAFYYDKPVDQNDKYQADAKYYLGDKKPNGENVTPKEYADKAVLLYARDVAQWKVLNEMAGPNGRLRALPWNEYRGQNPYLLVSDLFSGNPAERSAAFGNFWTATVPVLFEPLVKLFLPVVKFIDADASFQTRVYLLLCLVWSLAVWAFFGGIITRIAAVQLTGKDRVTLSEAARYVVARYPSYVLSPLVPLGIVLVIVVGLMAYGFVAMIPVVGDQLLYGLGLPLVLVGGLVMAILLVGLVGYPLMYATVSTEGSDTFDALSRSYNYVFQAPWHYLWYSFVAVLYGAAVTLFVVFLASLTVYLSKWAVAQAPLNQYFDRQPDYLFVHAPESFGWRELFLKGSPAEIVATPVKDRETERPYYVYEPANPEAAATYRKSLNGVEAVGAWMVAVWLSLAFLLMLGFSYSYFWSAATAIYLLMRKKVDETDLDEIYIEEELPEAPVAPPPAPAGAATPLPTVPPPATVPFPAAVPPVSPPPVAPPPVSPPVVVESTPTKTVTSTTILTTATDDDKTPDADKK